MGQTDRMMTWGQLQGYVCTCIIMKVKDCLFNDWETEVGGGGRKLGIPLENMQFTNRLYKGRTSSSLSCFCQDIELLFGDNRPKPQAMQLKQVQGREL